MSNLPRSRGKGKRKAVNVHAEVRDQQEVGSRFYPECYPSCDDEALRESFDIVVSDEYGQGIKTLSPCLKGQLVFRFLAIALPYQTLHSLQLYPGVYLHDPFVMGKVLHSCEPNMICDIATQSFYARKDIEVGEYLTMDYEQTEDELYRPFHCYCDAVSCRGFISGRTRVNTETER